MIRTKIVATLGPATSDVETLVRLFEAGVDKNADTLSCNCTAAGVLRSAKGINLPNTTVNIPSITDKDWECVDWAIENRLDYLGMSFVRKAEDVATLRQYLRDKVCDIH